MTTKYEKIVALKKEISKISLAIIERDQISINDDILDSLKTSPTTISMSILEDLCVSLGINLSEMVDTLDVEIETKAIKIAREEKSEKERKEKEVNLQALKDENKELIITLIEELTEEEDDYRGISKSRVNYFIIISKDVVGKKELKGLLEEVTYWERFNNDCGKARIMKLNNIGKDKFGFSQEATDDNSEFTYTYSLVESKVIPSERLAELINPSFLFHLDTPELYYISDDSYRKLFFDPSRVGKQVIPIINGN